MATLRLEPVFNIRLDFDLRTTIGPLSGGGDLGLVTVAGGTIEGPRLTGRVVPHSGGDWANIRTDGVVEINAHYVLEASDGTLIHVHNRGYVVPQRVQPDGRPSYFRVSPTFTAPRGPHDWLSRTLIIGSGERRTEPDHSLFNYYAVL
jgi:hypothetical protein